MATFFSNEYVDWWSSSSNQVYGTLTGDVRRDGNTVYLENMSIALTSTETSWGTSPWSFTVGGTTTSTTINAPPTTVALDSTSFSVSPSQTSASVSWSAPENSGSFTVNFPSGATPPSGGYISSVVPGTDSITLTGGVTSMGTGGSQTYAELIVLNAPYTQAGIPQRYEGFNSLSATKTITNSSPISAGGITISANTKYYKGVYAYNGVADAYRYNGGEVYTLPPDLTLATDGTQAYNTFSVVNVPITLVYPADGGALNKTAIYRIQKSGGTWGDWQTGVSISSGSAGSVIQTISLDTDSIYDIEFKWQTTAGDSVNAVSIQVETLPTHEAPTVGNWDFLESNTDVSSLLGTDTVFIQGISIPKMTVAQNQISVMSPATLNKVEGEFDSVKKTLSLDNSVYAGTFDCSTSGSLTGSLLVTDSLGAVQTETVARSVLPYNEPTLAISVQRIDEDGASQLSLVGEYAPLTLDNTNKNTISARYKISDSNGTVVDWTSIALAINENEYSASVSNLPTDYAETYLIEVEVEDAFNQVSASETLSVYDARQGLYTPQYSIEVWTRDGSFLADISKYLTTDLNITWKLNDVEDLNFSMSLDALELLRHSGSSVVQLLTPYAHDVKIRRNGDYIVGCQVVEVSVKIENDQIPTVQIKATGYLNIFKDQYLSIPFAGYSYPVMAHRLIYFAQRADTLLRNPTGDIDASYWLSSNGTIAQTSVAKDGAGAIQGYSTGAQVMGSQMRVPANTPVHYDFWVSVSTAGSIAIQERDLITNYSTAHVIATESISTTNTYTHITGDFTTSWDDGYFCIRNDINGVTMRLDNVYVSRTDDEDALNNHYVGTIYGGGGSNSATSGYVSDREFNYELQNVKDAVMDLVNMGEDNFDFEFTPDKKFKTYERKGEDRTDIEILYPGNVHSMTIERSATDMANKVQEIGSGIGDERLEIIVSDTASRQIYGTRESVITANNVSLEDTLEGLAQGELEKRSPINPVLTVTIQDGSINCGNIETGDVLAFRIGNYLGVLGQQQTPQIPVPMELLGNVEGWYRVKQINARISQDGVETLSLQLEFEGSFEES